MMRSFVTYLLLLLTCSVQGDEIPHAIIQTNLGIIEVKLNPEKAPETVENFLTYVKEGFYENTIFHRVVNNFVIQGGGYTVDYQKKPTHSSIPNEASNGLKNLRGTLAMARTADPHSSTSQFFINAKDNKFLDYKSSTPSGWGYCVFGKVVDGMDVVDKIARLPTDAAGPFRRDVPQTPVIIEAIKVEYVQTTSGDTSSSAEGKSKESSASSDRQKKSDASREKASATKQTPPADMQQEMLKDLDEIEEEPVKEKEPVEEIKEGKEKQKPKEINKAKENSFEDEQDLSQDEKGEVPPEESDEIKEKKKSKEVAKVEEGLSEDEKGLSQKEEKALQEKSLQEEQSSDQTETLSSEEEEKLIDKKIKEEAKKPTYQGESELVDGEQASQADLDQKSPLKHVQEEPDKKEQSDKKEEDKTMLSVVTKKENVLSPLKRGTKKTSTPPDPPTLPDKPEPPMN